MIPGLVIPAGLFFDPRWVAVSAVARALFVDASALVLARSILTKSAARTFTAADLPRLLPDTPKRRRVSLVHELVAVGLFLDEPEGAFAIAPEFLTPVSPAAMPTPVEIPSPASSEASGTPSREALKKRAKRRRLRDARGGHGGRVPGTVGDAEGDASPSVPGTVGDAEGDAPGDASPSVPGRVPASRAPSLSGDQEIEDLPVLEDSRISAVSSPSSPLSLPCSSPLVSRDLELPGQDRASARASDEARTAQVSPRERDATVPPVPPTDGTPVPLFVVAPPGFDDPAPPWAEAAAVSLSMARGGTIDVPGEWSKFVANVHERHERGDVAHASEASWRKWCMRALQYAEERARRAPAGRVVQADPPGPKAYAVASHDDPWDELPALAAPAPAWAEPAAAALAKTHGGAIEVPAEWGKFVAHQHGKQARGAWAAASEAEWQKWCITALQAAAERRGRAGPHSPKSASRIVQGGPSRGPSLDFNDTETDYGMPPLPAETGGAA